MDTERAAILAARAFCVKQHHEPDPAMSSRFLYDVSTSLSANPPRDVAWRFDPQQWKDHGGTLWDATQRPLWRALLASHISMWMPAHGQQFCLDSDIVFCWHELPDNRRLLLRDLRWDSFHRFACAGESLLWPATAPQPVFPWNATVMIIW